MKRKEDRLTEAIDILKRLINIGISNTEYGYKQTKAYLDLWIANGEPQSYTIEFARYGRIGYMTLPSEENMKASYILKATDELKRQVAEAD